MPKNFKPCDFMLDSETEKGLLVPCGEPATILVAGVNSRVSPDEHIRLARCPEHSDLRVNYSDVSENEGQRLLIEVISPGVCRSCDEPVRENDYRCQGCSEECDEFCECGEG